MSRVDHGSSGPLPPPRPGGNEPIRRSLPGEPQKAEKPARSLPAAGMPLPGAPLPDLGSDAVQRLRTAALLAAQRGMDRDAALRFLVLQELQHQFGDLGGDTVREATVERFLADPNLRRLLEDILR